MEGMVLFLVPVALLAITFIAAWMLVDVAFLGGDRKVESRRRASRRWQRPYIAGRELVAWARDTAKAAAERVLEGDPKERALTDLADELHEGTARAMLPQLRERGHRRPVSCPVGGQGEIGVTVPEVLAIADRVRSTLPKRQRQRILRRATAIAAARPVTVAVGEERRPPPCALQGEDCVCMTYGDRPLRCRPYHAGIALRSLADTEDADGDAAAKMADARGIAEGVEDGLVSGLDAAGLDSEVYELNAALSVALGRPDATRRWLDGEAIFATCARGPASFPRV